jgi:hypothetical protein
LKEHVTKEFTASNNKFFTFKDLIRVINEFETINRDIDDQSHTFYEGFTRNDDDTFTIFLGLINIKIINLLVSDKINNITLLPNYHFLLRQMMNNTSYHHP